jgi:hypothetical protein
MTSRRFRLAADLLIGAVELIAQALVLCVLLLLLIAGIEPSSAPAPAAPIAAPAPVAPVVAAAPVAAPAYLAPAASRRTVAELRKQARAAGLPRSLYRSGNRAELLNALGLA